MSNDRRLSAPGQLSNADDSLADGTHAGITVLPSRPLAEYALEHGLRPSASRPPFRNYIRDLWRRWGFMIAFATARNIAMYTEAKLGQLWQVLTPLLNAGVYFLIFGLLLQASAAACPNYLAFLVTGVFVFNFTQRTFIATSKVITDSLPLIRALQFPRAALPLAYVMIELQQMLLSMAVLVVIMLATGEPLTWYWLLVVPALALQTMFNAGIGDVRGQDWRAGQRLRPAAAVPDADLAVRCPASSTASSCSSAHAQNHRLGHDAGADQSGRHLHHADAPVAAASQRESARRPALTAPNASLGGMATRLSAARVADATAGQEGCTSSSERVLPRRTSAAYSLLWLLGLGGRARPWLVGFVASGGAGEVRPWLASPP